MKKINVFNWDLLMCESNTTTQILMKQIKAISLPKRSELAQAIHYYFSKALALMVIVSKDVHSANSKSCDSAKEVLSIYNWSEKLAFVVEVMHTLFTKLLHFRTQRPLRLE